MELTKSQKANGDSPSDSVRATPELFDSQAGFFEHRAGLPEDYCREIADRVVEIGNIGPGDLLVEVGAGTGQLGQWFGRTGRYAGFDLSSGMLRQFSRQIEGKFTNRVLIQADANASWPVADGVAKVIFSSRTMHLLQQEHVALEVLRIASRAGATLILGRVERAPESVRSRMANEMTDRLRLRGFVGRRKQRRSQKVFDLCCRQGAITMDPITVAKWRTSTSPQQSLDSWRSLTHLGGLPVPATIRANILKELEEWAEKEWGGLGTELETEETYVLSSIRLPTKDAGRN